MKKQILFILCLMASIIADAQYKVSSIDKSETANSVLHQVIETENSVLVYCTFTAPSDESTLYYLPRKMKAVKNNVNYKIINSINFPLWDEAEPRYLNTKKKGEKINYVLEFEKFDPTGGFDIVEDDTKHEDGMLNVYGIHVEKIDPKDVIDTGRFLDDGHVIFGRYKTNGKNYSYYIKDGLMMLYHDSWYGNDFLIHLEITNNSDHGVMFDLSKVRYTGTDKNGKPVQVVRYTPESYDARIEDDRRFEAREQTGGDVARMTESLIYHKRINTKNELGNIGLRALEQAYKRAQENRIQEYLQDHPNNDPKALRSNSIKPGESIVGFIPLKVKKCKNVKTYITMDDY
ncbi:MAG: hypothetical protein KBT29_02830, partial [Prevotellaceae bacterium]|nr:hypothetical protein [Candidatus Minthosoma caballi]